MAKFHPDKVSGKALRGISRQLGGWLDETTVRKFHVASAVSSPLAGFRPFDEASLTEGGLPSLAPALPPSFELRETFAVWTLSLDRIEEGLRTRADLIQLAKPTGRWHHQITCNESPVAFARSTSEEATAFDVCQLYVSDLARHIDDAIKRIDDFAAQNPAYAASNPLVRILFIPSYQTHAFWLLKGPPVGPLRNLALQALSSLGIEPEQKPVSSDVLIIDAPSYLRPLRPREMLSSSELLEAFREKEPLGGGLTFDPPSPTPDL